MDVRVNQRNEKPNTAGDRLNILLLTYLHVLQNIPRGLSDAISLILQKRNISYADQAELSIVSYSYCFKLLWAPIVDCVYFKKIGRRKTWVIPTQFSIGIFLILVSMNLSDWMGSEDGTRKPSTRVLGFVFFSCIFLASTQSIAVSGWSLTMLQKRNVGHAGTCDTIGFAISQFLSFVLFIVLESEEFCNKFRSVPQKGGFVTFPGFTLFWSVVFIASTALILVFKKETELDVFENDGECQLSLKESYTRLWQIIKIRPVLHTCFIFLTYQVGLGPVNGVARLKLIDAGVPSDTFALLTVPSLPFLLFVPFVLGRFLIGHLAMRTFVITYALKLILGIVYATVIFFTPYAKDENNVFPAWHYWLLLVICNVNSLTENLMFVAIYAFFSRISDPRFGGMYVSLLSAVASIGYRWPISVCLWLVDLLAIKICTSDEEKETNNHVVMIDGFFTETVLCTLIGILWLCWAKKKICELEDMTVSEWMVKQKSSTVEENKN